MNNQNSRFINLGVLALPIFCCLVGALLIVGLARNDGTPRPGLPPDQVKLLLQHLEADQATLAQARLLNTVISNRIGLMEYYSANEALDAEAKALLAQKNKLTNEVTDDQILQGRLEELRRKMDTTEAAIAAARARVDALRKRVTAAATNEIARLVDGYTGSLVLLECDGNGAIVHPGGQRLPLKATATELQPVYDTISNAGFVALVSRPGGFAKSYDYFERVVFSRVDEMNHGRPQPIGRCSFPLAEGEPLTVFITE